MTAALWGVGRTADGSLLPLSTEDIDHDTAAAHRALRSLGIGKDDHVIVISKNSQAGQVWPLLVALVEIGAVYSPIEPTTFDARRLDMYVRRLPCRAVIGVTDETIDGLVELGVDPAQVLASVPVVVAHPRAAERLAGWGIAARRGCALGPAVALDCRFGHLHLDGRTWSVGAADGRLMLTPSRDRAASPAGQPIPTDVIGRPASTRCECGSDDPWVTVDGVTAPTAGRTE